MDKIKLLTIAVLTLLLLNIGTLGFLILSGPKGHRPPHDLRPEPKEIISEKLHFDEKQRAEYDKLIQWHRGQIRSLEENIHATKNVLYQQLAKPTIDVKVKDSLIAALANDQKQIEATHFKHFEDIKKLCKNDQVADYNGLTEELSRLFGQHGKPSGPPMN